jgi:hypothetical protein
MDSGSRKRRSNYWLQYGRAPSALATLWYSEAAAHGLPTLREGLFLPTSGTSWGWILPVENLRDGLHGAYNSRGYFGS